MAVPGDILYGFRIGSDRTSSRLQNGRGGVRGRRPQHQSIRHRHSRGLCLHPPLLHLRRIRVDTRRQGVGWQKVHLGLRFMGGVGS